MVCCRLARQFLGEIAGKRFLFVISLASLASDHSFSKNALKTTESVGLLVRKSASLGLPVTLKWDPYAVNLEVPEPNAENRILKFDNESEKYEPAGKGFGVI